MGDVLVSPLGRSPGAVSGVYFALKQIGFEVSRVVTVGTSHDDVKLAANQYLSRLFQHINVEYDPIHIPALDLRGGRKGISPFVGMMGLALKNEQGDDHLVHVAVTGGRSGMGALAALAATVHGADHLWHLWVCRDIEENGLVDTTSQGRYPLYSLLNNPARMAASRLLNPTLKSDEWEAVELPFMCRPLRDRDLWEWRRTGCWPEQALSVARSLHVQLSDAAKEALPEVRQKIVQAYRSELLNKLSEHFSLEDLRTVCFHLVVDWDDLGGEGKEGKARELILRLERYQRLGELVIACQEKRPKVNWGRPLELVGIADVFPAGMTFARADQLIELAALLTRKATPQAVHALGELLHETGVVEGGEVERLREHIRAGSAPQELMRFADKAQKDRLGFWQWVKQNKDAITIAIAAGSSTASFLTLLLKALEMWLRGNGYMP